jgi:hypothetical protein
MPTMPFAPGRLSTTTLFPSPVLNRSATSLAMMSSVLPAVNGAMSLMWRVG